VEPCRKVTRWPSTLLTSRKEELRRFYQAVWNCRNFSDMVLIKTLFYTGVWASELVAIRLSEVNIERCQIRTCPNRTSSRRIEVQRIEQKSDDHGSTVLVQLRLAPCLCVTDRDDLPARLALVLLVAHLFHPVNRLAIEPLLNGDVGHSCGWCGPMPVFLSRLKPDHVTGPTVLNRTSPALDPPASRG
jgi:integrase